MRERLRRFGRSGRGGGSRRGRGGGIGGGSRRGGSEGIGGGVGTLELIIGVVAVLIVVIFLLQLID